MYPIGQCQGGASDNHCGMEIPTGGLIEALNVWIGEIRDPSSPLTILPSYGFLSRGSNTDSDTLQN